jgi:hypothetical protein
MPRISTDQPSSGKPLVLAVTGFVPLTATTIAEAPDFSIPSTFATGITADPANADRELRPGEVYLESPLIATNSTSTTRWVEVQIVTQGASGDTIVIAPQVPVPANSAIQIPVQGLRLLKTDFTATNGGRLQVRAENASAIKIYGSAVELEAATHQPNTEV